MGVHDTEGGDETSREPEGGVWTQTQRELDEANRQVEILEGRLARDEADSLRQILRLREQLAVSELKCARQAVQLKLDELRAAERDLVEAEQNPHLPPDATSTEF